MIYILLGVLFLLSIPALIVEMIVLIIKSYKKDKEEKRFQGKQSGNL